MKGIRKKIRPRMKQFASQTEQAKAKPRKNNGADNTDLPASWSNYDISKIASWYNEAMTKGKPDLSLTDPQPPQSTCQCPKYKRTVALYMMCAHVEREIPYCDCTSLVEILFKMHFIPSSATCPNAAIHFAMIRFYHGIRVIEEKPIEGFAEVANLSNEEGKPLKKTLKNVDLIYSRILDYSGGSKKD